MASPLADLTKDEVREASRELGLPNWNFAASPCLRSRLALNVEVSQPVGVHFALVLTQRGAAVTRRPRGTSLRWKQRRR